MYVYKTTLTGVSGSPYLSQFHSDSVAPFSQTDLQAFVDGIKAFWTSLNGVMKQGLTWTVDGTVLEIDSATGEAVGSRSVNGGSGAAADTGDMLPPANQALIRWNTGVFNDGRSIFGHTYVPAITEASVSGGVLIGGAVTILQNAANALINLSTTIDLQVWRRPKKDAQGVITRPGLGADVTAAVVSTKMAVLRSRRD